MFNERMQLQYDRVQLLKTAFTKQHDHLSEVSFHRINSPHPPYIVLLTSDILHLIKQFHPVIFSELCNKPVMELKLHVPSGYH
jgi:hypothetical protein